jgi:hypothetical protein
MNVPLFIFLFMIITGIDSEIPSLRSAYFRILDKYHFEQVNFCLPSLDILNIDNLYDCQIVCI